MTGSYDAIVVGSGITGLTAAKRLAERGVHVANVESGLFGGLVLNVNELEGAFDGSGADLASTLMLDLANLGCAALGETVTAVDVEGDAVVVTTDSAAHRARVVIVASGARLKRLGVRGEAALAYKGVSQCADCDGPMFEGQDVVVAGGGDSALQEALVLSRFCRRVRIVHHHGAFTAGARWVDAVRACGNVTAVPNAEITAIEGTDAVEGVTVRSLADASTQAIACSGVFAYIGLEPAASFAPAALARDAQGALIVDEGLATGLPNVWAAGAVRAGFGGTLRHAVHDAALAADAAWKRLA